MREIRLHPHHCDAWEVANSGNLPYMDRRAYEYAVAPNMAMTCGSDIHTVRNLTQDKVFAMVTEKPLESERDYVQLILSGKGFRAQFPPERMQCELQEPNLPVYWN